MATQREREKEREEEPVVWFTEEDPYCFMSREREHQYYYSLPRVIHMADMQPKIVPGGGSSADMFERARQGPIGLRVYLDWYYNKYQELKYPILTLTCMGGLGRRPAGR